MEFTIPNFATKVDNRLYCSPFLFSQFFDNPFKQEVRRLPIDFPYPFEEKQRVILQIPEGAKVLELKPHKRIELAKTKGYLAYKMEEGADGDLIIEMTLAITDTHFEVNEYAEIKALFDQFAFRLAEQIVIALPN